MVKFAHIADIHLGGWKQQPLQDLNMKSFQTAIDNCISENVDFALFAGDLFDSPYPSIDILKETFTEFKKLNEAKIPCFMIAGSHDYSVSGKTFLDVLEKTGFCKNVTDFEETEEEIILKPTICKDIAIYGFPGKKTSLEINDLRKIKLQDSPLFKILMLHTTIDKAKGDLPIDSINQDSLPHSDYCALGHIHIKLHYKNFVYPGPIFPNNFAELENLHHGHFCIVDTSKEDYLRRIEIKIKEIESLTMEVNDSLTATEEIISELEKRDFNDKIILLRVKGELEKGKNSDIDFQKIEKFAKDNGAYFMLKNTHDLKTKEVDLEFEIEKTENIEEETIKLYSEQNPSDFNSLIPQLVNSLSIEKQEGENSENFTKRILEESKKILKF
jgi:DNA repair exonuclease SbcCD nuclease subunit